MKRRVKKFCLWILVVAGIFGGVFGCILSSNAVWADPIRQTVKNGDSYIVVENTTRNNPEITITVEKDDGNNNNSGETIKVQPSNSNVYKLDDGSNSDNVLNSMTGQSSISSTVNGNKVNENSGETMDCDELLDEYADGGIGAMQWVLCPTMNNTAYTADWVDYITQDMLEIKADTYTGLGSAWGAVRNIANITMIVFLLIVIFSQVTGYGIDNYGIKKMLPRLVVMAIVINLSLYICQIAVDLSNILGTGLRDMFGGMVGSPSGGANFVTGAIIGIFSSAGSAVSAGVSAAAIGAGGWVAVVIAIVVLVLVIIVALVVLWLMIAARQIIVIFCIIISPLAFAAFILPNTQNLFKKWVELFKAALIIFPICGAVSGISAMIRSLADQGKFDLGIAGSMILMVLPFLVFFLLPSLLKQAISALGKLGGALTSVGNTVRSGGKALGQGVMRGVQNTEAYKNRQTEAARRRQSESSQRTIDKLEALKKQREDAGGQLTDTETRRLARAHETQRRLGLEDQAARTILTEKDYAGKSLDNLMADWNTAFDDGDVDRMNALTNVIVSRHGPGGVSSIASSIADRDGVDKDGNDVGIFTAVRDADGNMTTKFRNDAMEKSFTALQANMMQNSALANAMQNKASDVFQMVSGGGFIDGKRQNASAHAAHNTISTQLKDWATQSNGTLRRAAAHGGLTSQMAKDLLKSTDPAIQSGIQSDKEKRATLEAVAGGYVNRSWKTESDNKAAEQVAAQYRGMDANYAGKSAGSVHAEALAANAEFDRSKQQEMNDLHAQALEENKEFDRRAAEQARVAARDDVLSQINDNLNRITGTGNNSSTRQNVDRNTQERPGDGADGLGE